MKADGGVDDTIRGQAVQPGSPAVSTYGEDIFQHPTRLACVREGYGGLGVLQLLRPDSRFRSIRSRWIDRRCGGWETVAAEFGGTTWERKAFPSTRSV